MGLRLYQLYDIITMAEDGRIDSDPCRNLLVSILERAILDYYGYLNENGRLVYATANNREAIKNNVTHKHLVNYFFSTYAPERFGSLWFIAENLSDDPESFVKGIRKLLIDNPDTVPRSIDLVRGRRTRGPVPKIPPESKVN